jgi:Uma2 family endonuclease
MVLIASPPRSKTPTVHRLTVKDVVRLERAGSLHPEARYELIDGEIIDMPPIEAPHGESTDSLAELLIKALTPRYRIRSQSAIRLDAYSAPQPDIAILKRREGGYGKALPTAADIFLIIEVSDTTLRYDLKKKRDLYARAAIPEYWVLDVKGRALHVFSQPTAGSYAQHRTLTADEVVTCGTVAELSLRVAAMIGYTEAAQAS